MRCHGRSLYAAITLIIADHPTNRQLDAKDPRWGRERSNLEFSISRRETIVSARAYYAEECFLIYANECTRYLTDVRVAGCSFKLFASARHVRAAAIHEDLAFVLARGPSLTTTWRASPLEILGLIWFEPRLSRVHASRVDPRRPSIMQTLYCVAWLRESRAGNAGWLMMEWYREMTMISRRNPQASHCEGKHPMENVLFIRQTAVALQISSSQDGADGRAVHRECGMRQRISRLIQLQLHSIDSAGCVE